jgi:hypothetical protein
MILMSFSSVDFSDGISIIKLFRENPKNESLQTGSDVTFLEFLKYIIYQTKNNIEHDTHWRCMWKLCLPCEIHYDFIGRYENLLPDAQHVLRRLDIEEPFPSAKTGPVSNSSSSALKKHYSVIPKNVINEIAKIYKLDFEMFGYDMNISNYLTL